MKSSKSVILNKGDVIKTNPQNGYWGGRSSSGCSRT